MCASALQSGNYCLAKVVILARERGTIAKQKNNYRKRVWSYPKTVLPTTKPIRTSQKGKRIKIKNAQKQGTMDFKII